MQDDRPKILVAGGGIGGLAFALAAMDLDACTTVWERAAELHEAGAGLLLSANAMWVLDRLGIRESVARVGRLIDRWQILDSRGRVLKTFRGHGAEPMSISVARAAFHDVLRQVLPEETLILDREVAELETLPETSQIRVRAVNGVEMTADIVIGADGGKSRVREAVFGSNAAHICPYVGWRALIDLVPKGWDDGRLTESWSDGCRFGIAQISPTRSYWYATENVTSRWKVDPGNYRAHLLAKFRRWHAPICQMIEATPEHQILLNSIAEHPPLPHWSRGRVGLLGDAAHLMTPNLGQGAALALEDGWILARSFRQRGCGEPALQEYERLRKPRAERVVWQSRQVGRMIQLERPWFCGLRDFGMRCTPDALAALALAPVFRFRA
jgi:2-polyprenyl-6-methoxyphenol hydroxylase-like FAD-dependent oxidoreductase